MLLTSTTTPSNNSCQSRCMGSEPEVCGGSNALSLYVNPNYTAPIEKPFIGRYTAQTCVSDPNTNGRALQGAFTTSVNMTNEYCVKYCLGLEFHYAG